MSESPETPDDGKEASPLPTLSEDEITAVAERKAGSPKVVHEVIRLQGDEELDRPLLSLVSSAFAAGFSICASILAESALAMRLPTAEWSELLSKLGYSVGFVIVIMGNLQLFTENTITVILPLATHPTLRNLGRLGRLWSIVFCANLMGTFLVALVMAKGWIISGEQLAVALELSAKNLGHDATTILLRGVPAGFLVASIAWIMPNARGGSEFWLIVLITYVISICGFSHVVAGSGEAWLLLLAGKVSFWGLMTGFIIPALLGNILGGTGLFAVLAHGQVREEIAAKGDDVRSKDGASV
ncbi:formate/nitrite transporter family protein [Lichenifustis flavocetrariae]|uniref:Formate/nitrite transporter family protein n=1 Tax=Lichenifustis flavocetrariae TaxID=2949735 RepID=A0AA42CHH6_9HYPH|nr:formate/nitrite transporter family protein [Lichenifustis flavocetrariae]MCW6507279.1 formate/nitrite transporter family protein [Lichenifustis flavocetrariae]